MVKFAERLWEAGGVGRVMVSQLVGCSLSFASMLEEARAGESHADFVSKCSIGLKECRESWMRVRVCHACGIGPSGDARSLEQEADELVAIMTRTVANARANQEPRNRQRKPPRSFDYHVPDS